MPLRSIVVFTIAKDGCQGNGEGSFPDSLCHRAL
jgi:hypothetical protein